MSDEPIALEEVNPQGETHRQLNQEEIEENVAKLLTLLEQDGKAAYCKFFGDNPVNYERCTP